MDKKFLINTYGCQMNVHESEKIASILTDLGMTPAINPNEADVIVFNTCCIRQTAEAKIFGHLGKVKKLKESNPNLIVVLCGCLPQQPQCKDLKKRFPYVNLIIGTHNLPHLGEYIKRIEQEKCRIYDIWEEASCTSPQIEPKRTQGFKAFVNIMYGCNNFCSYCIVPYVRGRERSRDTFEILNEIEKLIDNGYKEITLLGQNVNSYNYNDCDFSSLLNKINNINSSKFRLKFMTSHPKDLSEQVVEVIANGKNLAKYIHLPVQAGSDRILHLMNRKYTNSDYQNKIDFIRKLIPNCGITTDIMVGFPSETEQDFLDTMSLVERVKFNNIFSFIYNRRSGTVADKMTEQINHEIKIERIERLIKLQAQIGVNISQSCVGKRFEVLIEDKKKNICFGKTESDIAVTFSSNKNVGDFVDVVIDGYKNTRLTAKERGEVDEQ